MEPNKLSVENVLGMKGGNGDASYAHNSLSVQTKMVQAIKPILEDAIEKNMTRCITLRNDHDDNIFRIADLGCATGTNALLAADAIVKSVKRKCIRHSIAEPEFQVYFADLPSNDFNLLLRMLPPYNHVNKQSAEDFQPMLRSRCYFAAAVVGSFYKRLFPRRSLNFVHSSIALQWLSKVPESIEDKSSDAWNGGRIFIRKEAVAQAYLRQFSKDLTAFLRCRADEVLPEGCMLLAFLCRKSSHILHQDGLGVVCDHLEAAFHDLVAEGLIEEEVVDSFNIPYFGASPDEFKSIVEMENSFYVERLRLLSGFQLHPVSRVNQGQERLFGEGVANHYRALFENMEARGKAKTEGEESKLTRRSPYVLTSCMGLTEGRSNSNKNHHHGEEIKITSEEERKILVGDNKWQKERGSRVPLEEELVQEMATVKKAEKSSKKSWADVVGVCPCILSSSRVLRAKKGILKISDDLADEVAQQGEDVVVGKISGSRPDLLALRKWIEGK